MKPGRLQSRGLVAVVAVLVVLVAVGVYLVLKPSDRPAPSAGITCNPQYTITRSSIIPLNGGIYQMQANEYNSNAPFAMCGDGGEDFKITKSQISATQGTPGGYPSIYRGCHWGACTKDSGLPIQVSSLEKNTSQVRLSYDTRVSARGVWDASFDIFFTPCNDHGESQSGCTQNTQPAREMMIWLSHYGPAIPGGNPTEVTIGGLNFNLWRDHQSMWYVMRSPSLTHPHVHNLVLGDFVKDAVNRGYIPSPSWYLMDVEAGFEIWQGGQGLQANSLSICTPSPVGCEDVTRAPASPLCSNQGFKDDRGSRRDTAVTAVPPAWVAPVPPPRAWSGLRTSP